MSRNFWKQVLLIYFRPQIVGIINFKLVIIIALIKPLTTLILFENVIPKIIFNEIIKPLIIYIIHVLLQVYLNYSLHKKKTFKLFNKVGNLVLISLGLNLANKYT